jgi:hypothetical protein
MFVIDEYCAAHGRGQARERIAILGELDLMSNAYQICAWKLGNRHA